MKTPRILLFVVLVGLTSPLQAQHSTKATIQDLNGIVAAFRCSGALVSMGQSESEPAFILSAGHCSADEIIGEYSPGIATVQLPILQRDEYFSYYQQKDALSPITLGNFQLASIYYGTMTKEDVSLFQTAPALSILKAAGVRIFQLADQLPKVGQRLQITSGLWGQTQSCTVEKIIPNNTVEKQLFGISPSPIEMQNTILISKECTAQSGWSGSPLIDPVTGLIYGVVSRIYAPAPGSTLAEANATPRILVSSVVELRKCMNKNGKLDFNNPDCKLPFRTK